jgi:hypothetical protein
VRTHAGGNQQLRRRFISIQDFHIFHSLIRNPDKYRLLSKASWAGRQPESAALLQIRISSAFCLARRGCLDREVALQPADFCLALHPAVAGFRLQGLAVCRAPAVVVSSAPAEEVDPAVPAAIDNFPVSSHPQSLCRCMRPEPGHLMTEQLVPQILEGFSLSKDCSPARRKSRIKSEKGRRKCRFSS